MKIRKHESQLLGDCTHRTGVTECPYCSFSSRIKSEKFIKKDQWEHKDNTDYIILDPQIYSKSSSVIFISTCPSCREKSWQHQDLDYLCGYHGEEMGYTKSEIKKLKQEKVRRLRLAAGEFVESLCYTCKKLEGLNVSNLYYFIDCPGRCGGPETKCDNYKKG